MSAGLREVLRERIPLTRALGLEVERASPALVRLGFPLEPNHNHKDTAFGGSLYAAAVLAAWGLLWCACRETGVEAEAVVASSSERFLRPVSSGFSAECTSDPDALKRLCEEVRAHGSGRIRLKSAILCGGDLCLAFEGTFVLDGA